MVHKAGYAKIMINLVDGTLQKLDRTIEPHKFKFDIDVKSQFPPKNMYAYWGSTNSVEEAEQRIKEKNLLTEGGNVRIVEADTGKIIKKI